MKRIVPLACVAALAFVPTAQAEWKPSGPITLNIGFKAGGGTDTQARLIGEALAAKKGWTPSRQRSHDSAEQRRAVCVMV